METKQRTIHDLAREFVTMMARQSEIELEEYQDFRLRIADELSEIGVTKSAGIPLDEQYSLACIFERGVLRTFEVIENIPR